MKKKRIPYGISNFEMLREENYLYVDKTKYIEVLEDFPPYQFFIRPRRFGKSLFVSLLENYYALHEKGKFQRLFGDLYIGQNPTPNHNSYLVLTLSFAGIVTSEGKDRLIKSFDDNVVSSVASLMRIYHDLFQEGDLPESVRGAEMAVRFLAQKAMESNQKIFIIIDEYDNFANDLIGTGNKQLYQDLLSSEGYVRAFYKAIKDGTMKSIQRIFMTGVSPIMLDDLTSGFNITTNLTLEPICNEMMGFTEEEIRGIIGELGLNVKFNEADLLREMRRYYNGYLFSKKGNSRLYNSDMALYFLAALKRGGEYPDNLLDNNVKTDYRKLRELAFNFRDEETIERIIQDEEIPVELVERFQLDEIYTRKENFISLLYYLGMLTIKDTREGQLILGIPNYVSRIIYWEYFLNKLEKEVNIENERLQNSIRKMRKEGDISEFAAYLKEMLSTLSNRDSIRFDEKYIKIILLTLFNIDGKYVINSEYEVERGYLDLFLIRDVRYEQYTNYEWLIELKYLKEADRHRLEEIKREGIAQLTRYGASERIKHGFKSRQVKKILLVVVGKSELSYFES